VPHRMLVLLGCLTAAAVLVSSGLAANVKIRVEGKTQTVYGAAPQPVKGVANPLEALDAASFAGEFYYLVTTSSFGDYVSQIGKYAGDQSSGWVFKVNGVSPPVGAKDVALKDGDSVLWYYATFGPAGGPPTLDLQRLPGNCYRVAAVNDAGKPSVAAGAVLSVDGRRFKTANGRACVGKHVGTVRATLPGAVRSNAVK
jgi:Domain of unknown function (DUF4430)